MIRYWLEYAWLPTGIARDVLVEIEGGRFADVRPSAKPQAAQRLTGLTVPGLANAHSHAFHRALRGRTHDDGGTFWTWRTAMYAVADRLQPDTYRQLATAVFAEMAAAGVTCVGEFHYLHHDRDGTGYADPNAMSYALVSAAQAAGLRITLLDTCYLAGGLTADGHTPLTGPQVRFGDGSALGWATRVRSLDLDEHAHARRGAAIHSVRGVPADQLATVAAAARELDAPLHVHLSEQPAENDAALAYYGCTPTELLARHGVLGPSTTAVHATHLTASDITMLGDTRTITCACPTTEADLADGIGPFPELREAGSSLCLGSDQHAHTDLLDEARRLEEHERLRSGRRGTFRPAELVDAATRAGHRSLGWHDAGVIEVGARADLVAIDLRSPRTAGAQPGQLVMAATAADVTEVIVDGEPVVRDGVHRLGSVGHLLDDVLTSLWSDPS